MLDAREKNIAILKEQLNKLASQQKDLLTYFKLTKEKNTSLEAKSSDLMTENHKLKIRAATAWEEFTPRPDFTRFMQILSLEPAIYKDKSSKQITNELMEHINNKIKSTVDSTSNVIRTLRSRTKTTKEKNDTYLEVPKIHSKTDVKSKSNSSHSIQNSFDSIIENEENMSNNKKNISIMLLHASPVIDLEMKEIHRDNYSENVSNCIVAAKRKLLMSLEKKDDSRKMRSFSPHKNL